MDVVLLHNAGSGDGDRSAEELAALLRRQGYQPACFSLEAASENTDLLDQGEFIVVAGGDGSVKRLATRLAHRKRPIAPLPIGTANNIATSLGVTGSTEEIVAGWRDGRRRSIDLGLAKGPWGERYFIEAVGIGLIGRNIATLEAIDDASDREFEKKDDKLYRDLCVLFSLANEMPPLRIVVERDGEDCSGNYLLLEALNISRTGPSYELAQQADPGDGHFDLVTVRADERSRLLESLRGALRHLARPAALPSQPVRHLHLRMNSGELRIDDTVVWPDADAGATGEIEVEISVEPRALEFVLPPARPRSS